MRLALAALMILHGIAHLVGFAGSWHLGELPYKTTVLGGRVDLGDTGIRAAGLLWLTAAMAFVVVGAGTALDYSWWAKAALYVTLASLALTIMEFPEAKLGLVVNLAILAVLFVMMRATA
jgi:hypothetical protein